VTPFAPSLRSAPPVSVASAVLVMLFAGLVTVVADANSALAQGCQRQQFEAVVDDAAQTLRTIAQTNTPVFQRKLRALKDKRGWTHDQFVKDGASFVRDDKILEFDDRSAQFLARLNVEASSGAEAAQPDCALLSKLRETLAVLVTTQTEKWRYMMTKIDAALEAP
jgi:hypothetical protein